MAASYVGSATALAQLGVLGSFLSPPLATDITLLLAVGSVGCNNATEPGATIARDVLRRSFGVGLNWDSNPVVGLIAQLCVTLFAASLAQGAVLLCALLYHYHGAVTKIRARRDEEEAEALKQRAEGKWAADWHYETKDLPLLIGLPVAQEAPPALVVPAIEGHNSDDDEPKSVHVPPPPPPTEVGKAKHLYAHEPPPPVKVRLRSTASLLHEALVTWREWVPPWSTLVVDSYCPGVFVAGLQTFGPASLVAAFGALLSRQLFSIFAASLVICFFGACMPAVQTLWHRHWRLSAYVPFALAFRNKHPQALRFLFPRGAWVDPAWIALLESRRTIATTETLPWHQVAAPDAACNVSLSRGISRWNYSTKLAESDDAQFARFSGEVRRWYSVLLPWRCPGLHCTAGAFALRSLRSLLTLGLVIASSDGDVCDELRLTAAAVSLVGVLIEMRFATLSLGACEVVGAFAAACGLAMTALNAFQAQQAANVLLVGVGVSSIATLVCGVVQVANLRWLRIEEDLQSEAARQLLSATMTTTHVTDTAGAAPQRRVYRVEERWNPLDKTDRFMRIHR